MPLYDYQCPTCGPFTAFCAMADYAKPARCHACDAISPRAILTAPAVAGMDAGLRRGLAINERSRHEPRRSSGAHPSGCNCCSSPKRPAAEAAGAAKSFAGRRPWMISH